MKPIEPGQRWKREVPFKLDERAPPEFPNWIPGCNYRGTDYRGCERWEGDGEGTEYRKVIAIVDLPAPYMQRVFYLRAWVDPGGKEFGNGKLLCCGRSAFSAWLNRGAQLVDPTADETEREREVEV